MNGMKKSLPANGLTLFILMFGVFAVAAADAPLTGVSSKLPWLVRQPDDVGPNYKSWRIDSVPVQVNHSKTSALGQLVFTRTNPPGRVMEMTTGMHYWDGERWSATDPRFELTQDAFVANRVQHKVRLNGNLNAAGAVTVSMQDGTVLNSTPVGIALYDPQDGRFAVIAAITNSIGMLVGSNQVVYQNAFSGGVCADVVYTLEQGSFEQDVIITGRLSPVDYGFPTNSRLQILSEFYEAPQPEKIRRPIYVEQKEDVRKRKASPDLVDELLRFGEFVIGTGRAYTPPTKVHTNGTQTIVAKEFKTIEGRTFLIESVDCLAIRKALEALPECSPKGAKLSAQGYATIPKPQSQLQADVKPRRASNEFAKFDSKAPRGVVIDYKATLQPAQPTVLRGDTTYLVSGTVYVGTLVIEGGAVIKYKANASINVSGSVTCKTSSYRPAVFTCVDDNSVGETMENYPNSGYNNGNINTSGYAYPALRFEYVSNPNLSNLRFCYAQEAIQFQGGYVFGTVSHSQLLNCVRGIVLTEYEGSGSGEEYGSGSGGGSFTLNVRNTLFSAIQSVFIYGAGSGSGAGSGAWFQHCTFNAITTVKTAYDNYPVTFQNSVFANVAYLTGGGEMNGAFNGFFHCAEFGTSRFRSDNSPFQTVAGGGYYLTDQSGFRNKGSGTPGDLLADLQQRTTYPPIVYEAPISWPTSLPVVAQRDVDAPDLGYHYDPLDYLINSIPLSAPVTIGEGVAIGITGDCGFVLQSGAHVNSAGSPKLLNRICYYGNVQESGSPTAKAAFAQLNTLVSGNLSFRFTDLAMRPGMNTTPVLDIPQIGALQGELAFRDCQLRGCYLVPSGLGANLTLALTNNFVEYSALSFTYADLTSLIVYSYNNLFRNNSCTLNYQPMGNNPFWVIRDNLFDGTPQSIPGSQVYLDKGNNGFIVGTANSLGGTGNKINLTAGYVAGKLGNYYYPATGGQNTLAALINSGSRLASEAGLYHYGTVGKPNNNVDVKEESSQVDIGYHYVALSANANPNVVGNLIDTDGDGLSDYLEDINGNGYYDFNTEESDANMALAITSQPVSQSVVVGNDAFFQVTAIEAPLSYGWYYNGNYIYPNGSTERAFYKRSVKTTDAGNYSVRVGNVSAPAPIFSSPAILTVLPALPAHRASGMISWWKLEDNTDDVLANHPAEVIGNFYGFDIGKVGKAAEFYGNPFEIGYLRVPGSSALNSASWSGFSLEAWLWFSGDQRSGPVFEQWDNVSGQRLTVSYLPTLVEGQQYTAGALRVTWVNSQGIQSQITTSPEAVRIGTFSHVALIYDASAPGNRLKLYVNGNVVASGMSGVAVQLGSSDLFFDHSPSELEPLDADTIWLKIDEISLYNRALTTAEVLELYTASVAGKTPLCTSAPSDVVAWWEGQNNGADVFGYNPATVQGSVSFTRGFAKQAFTFTGSGQVRVPASSALDVGQSVDGFTVEAWVNPNSVSTARPILQWNSGIVSGVALWVTDDGYVAANLRGTDLESFPLISGVPLVPGVYQHVALTCEPDLSGLFIAVTLYLDGQAASYYVDTSIAPFVPRTSDDFYIGSSPKDDLGVMGTQFAGQIDEVTIYNRALSSSEVNDLVRAAGGGKCGMAPEILTPPLSQVANAGNNVILSVVASGTSLNYQWFAGATPITGATAPSVQLNNVQATTVYTVQVWNDGSSVNSAATVTVNPIGSGTPPVIDVQPASQVLCAGSPLNLSVTAHGSGAVRYQWCKNGINIPGATAATYTRSESAPGDVGNYSVVVYDSAGHATSANASVTVHPRPTAYLIGDASISPGQFADLWVVLSGSPPWTVTWSDGTSTFVQTGVTDNPHWRAVAPTTTTDYSVASLADAHCNADAGAGDLSGSAHVVVSGASVLPAVRAGCFELLNDDYTDFTFAGDMTYLIGKTISFHGTTTIEGGTVVKFTADPAAKIVIEDGELICKTSPYHPAIFTARDNHNHGYYASGDDLNGYYGSGISLAFTPSAAVKLQNLRFFNLGQGLSIESAGTYDIYDCQFIDCDTAIAQGPVTASINLYNGLFSGDSVVFAPNAGGTPHLVFQHLTVDSCGEFISNIPGAGRTWQGVNSLLVNIQNSSSIPASLVNVGNTCHILSSGSGVFQTAVDGSYYLAEGSTYRGAGTLSTINGDLLVSLTQKSTRPPLFINWLGMSGSMTLFPQTQRYISGTQPDVGYYYDALDYVVAGLYLTGGHLEILPGTAIGMSYDYNLGLDLWEGSSIRAIGTASKPITFVPTTSIQEGPYATYFDWPGFLVSFTPNYWPNEDGNPPPYCELRFCNFLQTSGISHHFWGGRAPDYFGGMTMTAASVLSAKMQDCQFAGGWIDLGEPHYRIFTPVDYGGESVLGSVVWHNNFFNRVNINLDPDTGPVHWGDRAWYENPTIDLQLLATNNLFHGGFLAMVPVPATKGNWVFENNLFDKVVFAQDPRVPLNYDFNAYWPCVGYYDPQTNPEGELLPGQTGALLTTGISDDVNGPNDLPELIVAPPYQSGPLGNFYLPAGIDLDGAGHGTPGEVGLYHYTTRVDQTKEGDEIGNVNIGFHYVATTSLSSKDLIDTDGDGIPDYVEDANGNGLWDSDTETKMNDMYTDTGIADPVNERYDDIDLDGDGMVGRIEKALSAANPLPLTPNNPLSFAQVSEIEPGVIGFEVQVGNALVESVGIVELRLNGGIATMQGSEASPSGNKLIVWNSNFDPPGTVFLQPYLSLSDKADVSAVLSCAGTFLPYHSENVLQFAEAGATFDESGAYLDAILPFPNATYTIDLYDVSAGGQETLIRTIGPNSTSDGTIEVDWNVTQADNATLYTGNTVSAVFNVTLQDSVGTPVASGSGKKTLKRPPGAISEWSPNFNFVYLYGPRDARMKSAFAKNGAVWNGMQRVVDVLIAPRWPWEVYQSHFNRFLPDSMGEYPGYLKKADTDKGPLLNTLGGARQFYCLGHNNDSSTRMQGGVSIYDNDGIVTLDSDEIAHLLGNEKVAMSGMQIFNPYRFVWLDGCGTAKNRRWHRAFGIIPMSYSFSRHSARSRVGPQAFVGWAGEWGNGLAGFRPNEPVRTAYAVAYTETLQALYVYWMSGQPLANCIKFASDKSSFDVPLAVLGNENAIDPDNPSVPYRRATSKIYVIGHSGLTVNGLNPSYDYLYRPPYQQ